MEHVEGIKRFKVYISYDYADSDKSEELQEFFLKKGILIQCDRTHYDTPEDQRVKLWAVKAIRSCDVFILLISHNSGDPEDWLKKMLRYEYAEAINFNKNIIYLCLDDPKNISLLTSDKLSIRPKDTYLILPEKDNSTINYQALLSVLKDCGCLIVDENKTIGGKYNGSSIEGQYYDVFISYKSEDEEYARIVYDILQSRGLKVFFSKETLLRLGKAEYHKQIDTAIDRSVHMVIVATSREHIESEWVEHEWLLFFDEKLAGRKKGNLITVLAGDLTIPDLPISLRNLEAVPLVRGEIERLLEYVRKESVESVDKEAEDSKGERLLVVLEDNSDRVTEMKKCLESLKAPPKTIFFDNAPDMIHWLVKNFKSIGLMSLDHDLGPNRVRDGETFDPGTGKDVVLRLIEHSPLFPVILHTSNYDAVIGMLTDLELSGWEVVRTIPMEGESWIRETWLPMIKRMFYRERK